MKFAIIAAAGMAVLAGVPARAAISIFEQLSPTPTAYVHGLDYGTPGIVIDDTIAFGPRFMDIVGDITNVAGSGFHGLSDGCSTSDFGGDVSGKIALVSRGTCEFVQKAFAAQQAGALAVLIADDDPSVHSLDMSGSNPDVSITAFRVSYDLGSTLAEQTLTTVTTVRLALGNDLVFDLSAVPEPATWAMLVVGFGAVGNVLRSRRRSALRIV